MTRGEALFYCNQWAHGGAYRLSEHAAAIDFIHYCYSDGVELVERKLNDDEIAKIFDETDLMFANELSGKEDDNIMSADGLQQRSEWEDR